MKTDIQLHQGDCLEVLKTLNDNSIDSVVTDPPYGINFMGKKWDYNVPSVEVWQEVLRVLKPGGHALVACGTRTQHRMAVNLEDANFEIRDIVAWVYGSGFPKSQNIGKAVDKNAGAKREILGQRSRFRDGATRKLENTGVRGRSGSNFAYKHTFKEDSGGSGDVGIYDITAPATLEAQQWEGWGTALKPAMELFTLCRKPIEEKTIAKNILKYNTGGINIDGCRVGSEQVESGRSGRNAPQFSGTYNNGEVYNGKIESTTQQGRFPANFIHDGSDEVVNEFPENNYKSKRKFKKAGTVKDTLFKGGWNNVNTKDYLESGSASRFFYAAKASKSERNKGLEDFTEKEWKTNIGADSYTKSTHRILKRDSTRQNNHPTVKPIKLMKYLCRLITPVNGIVLDPYMGSGSTGIAAKEEGFNFTGIELDKDYFEIAKARINAKEKQEKLF